VEKATLFIQGTKVTSGMKHQLASKLSDGKLKDYITDKEKWAQYTFGSVAWQDYETAFKRTFQKQTGKHQHGLLLHMAH
jgi:hypothetical protein